jgi:hypothetical protein
LDQKRRFAWKAVILAPDNAWAMSRENVAIVRRMYEAFYGGDAAGALACFDPEVVIDLSRRLGGRDRSRSRRPQQDDQPVGANLR